MPILQRVKRGYTNPDSVTSTGGLAKSTGGLAKMVQGVKSGKKWYMGVKVGDKTVHGCKIDSTGG